MKQNAHMTVELLSTACPHISDNYLVPQASKEVRQPCMIKAMHIFIFLLGFHQSLLPDINCIIVEAPRVSVIGIRGTPRSRVSSGMANGKWEEDPEHGREWDTSLKVSSGDVAKMERIVSVGVNEMHLWSFLGVPMVRRNQYGHSTRAFSGAPW